MSEAASASRLEDQTSIGWSPRPPVGGHSGCGSQNVRDPSRSLAGLAKRQALVAAAGIALFVSLPTSVWASEGTVNSTTWLVLGGVLAASVFAGELSVRLRQPRVLGEVLAGVLLGNLPLLGIHALPPLGDMPELRFLAELGVLLLLFAVGLESTLSEMRKAAFRSGVVALVGVVVPLLLGLGAIELARGFAEYLDEVTAETRRLLDVVELTQGTAFESMLEQVLGAFSAKTREILGAERAALYLLDEERDEVWSFVTCEHGEPLEVRLPRRAGAVGQVIETGQGVIVADVRSNPALDRGLGTETRSVLAVPLADSHGEVFAVAEVANKSAGLPPFDEVDRDRLTAMTASIGVLLETWWRMSCQCRSHGVGRGSSCCGSPWRHSSGHTDE